jgi:hypothetical protein
MDNHYHLLVETEQPTLSRGMREVNGTWKSGVRSCFATCAGVVSAHVSSSTH